LTVLRLEYYKVISVCACGNEHQSPIRNWNRGITRRCRACANEDR
jgi:hypothetical protein